MPVVDDLLIGIRLCPQHCRADRTPSINGDWGCYHGTKCHFTTNDQFPSWKAPKSERWFLWSHGSGWCFYRLYICGSFSSTDTVEIHVLCIVSIPVKPLLAAIRSDFTITVPFWVFL